MVFCRKGIFAQILSGLFNDPELGMSHGVAEHMMSEITDKVTLPDRQRPDQMMQVLYDRSERVHSPEISEQFDRCANLFTNLN
jgi:hypothetical protein